MLVKAIFESVFCKSGGNLGWVYKALGEAFTLEWACFFSFTIVFAGLP